MLTAYKYLIVGIALMFAWSALHYISKVGGTELILGAISNDSSAGLIPPTVDSVTGAYICDSNSGCNNKYVLLLKSDQTAEMILVSKSEDADSQNMNYSQEEHKKIERNSIVINDSVFPTDNNNNLENIGITSSSTISGTSSTTSQATEKIISEDVEDLQKNVQSENNQDSLSFLSDNKTKNNDKAEKGSWDLTLQNILVVTFNESGTTTYEVPQKIVVKGVGASILSKINYTKSVYKDMEKPVFIKMN